MRAHHHRFTTSVVLIAAALVVGAGPAHAVPTAAAAGRPAATEEQALAAAEKSDERVEVVDLRSETTQVFAEPDGRLIAESAAVPQRVRRGNGTWAPVDLTLRRSADGTVRPGASVADVRFSGGGKDPLVTLVRGGRTLTLSWPDKLPEPSLAGAAATYSDVLIGVDLVVRATDTGFSHVLVVKTPKAAADPDVREVRYRLGGDTQVNDHPGGGLQAVADGVVLATAPPATMWNSPAPAPAGLRASAAQAPPEPSTPVEPGSNATVARVDTSVVDDHLVLRPDPALLEASATAFPLYVDPNWSTGKDKWAYATNDNTNNTDTSRARVGKDPEGSRTYRSFFNFNTAFLNGKHVEKARVEMELDHSASCDKTWTHMFHSGAIASTPRTRWSPGLTTWVAATESRAPEGAGCPGKNDQVVNFDNPALTIKMAEGARKSWGNMTFGFCACNADGEYESSTNRWKKFFPNKAKLIVEYATFPAAPSRLSVSGVACPASSTLRIGAAQPVFTATYEDGDEASNQTLTATYEFAEVLPGGGTSARAAPGSRSVPAGSSATTAKITGLVEGGIYRIRTRATDPAPYNLQGPWSPWCTFEVDTRLPAAPTITVVTAPTLPGTAVKVTLTSNDRDVVTFAYGWDNLPLRKVVATGTTVKTATVSLTAPRYGGVTLYAWAEDSTGNGGVNASREFQVGRPSEAIAHWRLESYPGADPATALDDLKPAVGGDTPLTWESSAPDTGWQDDARLIGGSTAAFDRTKGGDGGAARTLLPALDTSTSFSVAAWARVDDDTTYQTVVSKEGSAMSLFRLQYRPAQKSWCMTMRARDVANSAGVAACAPAAAFAVGRWTHLAGVFDDAETRIKLYVDGALAATLDPPADFVEQWAGGWNAGGPLVVGRSSDTAFTPRFIDFLHGEVADVQVFDRALVDQDLVGQRADEARSNKFDEPGIVAPVQVGRWDFKTADSCYAPGEAGTCQSVDVSGWDRRLVYTGGADVGPGVWDNALSLDGTHYAGDGDPLHGTPTREFGLTVDRAGAQAPVIRTDQPFTVATWVSLGSTATDQTVLSQDTTGAGYSGFDLAYRAADHRWVFSVRNGPAVADAAQRSVVTVNADDATGWHHLVAVFDPGRKQLRLYLDGNRAGAAATHAGMVPWHAAGPLVVGRSEQPAGYVDWLDGSLDNVTAWQGVLTDTSIRLLQKQESAAAPTRSAAE